MQCRLKLKKLTMALILIFLCSMVLGALPVQPASAQFFDINGHWAEKQINNWAGGGLAGGYSDGTFKPGKQITRAEFVALINRAFKKQDKIDRADFKDVKDSHWFYAEVAVAQADGFCTGYSDGTFRPLQSITRQEAASIICRLLSLDATDTGGNTFTDAENIAPWAWEAVNAVAKTGIMSGYKDGSFRGTNPITRAETVVTLDRAINYSKLAIVEPDGVTGNVLLDGKAMENAVVSLFAEKGTEPIETTISDKDGTYAFQVDAGIYDITAVKDKYVAYAAGVSLFENGAVQDLTLAEGALISGQLLDKNGHALKNTKLFFTTNPTFLTTTDGTGAFSVYVPGEKRYTVRGYKNNKPDSGLEILAEKVEADKKGSRSISRIKTSYAMTTSKGSSSGGGGNNARTVATPTTTPPPGAVLTGTEVTLSTSTEGATIRYTIDGSEPNTESTKYSTSITITEAVTIKAKAFKNGWNASSAATFSYTVIPQTIPVNAISITGEGDVTTIEEGESLQMTAEVEPANATDSSITWHVEAGTGTATIDTNGLLTGIGAGTVTVKATANDGSEVFGNVQIIVVKPSPFAGGDGSGNNPYQVATGEQLDKVREYRDKHFIQVADINLGVSPWNDGEGWEPIGGYLDEDAFNGSYDGNGYVIRNLRVDRTGKTYSSLFGRVKYNCTLKNITLEDVSIRGGDGTGGLAGYVEGAVISNSHITGIVTGTGYYTGGLVGTLASSTITGSHSTAVVSGEDRFTGGLVGMIMNGASITDSHVTGNISGTEYVGGLVGSNGSGCTISQSDAIAVSVTGNAYVGGAAGQNSGNISESHSAGTVLANNRAGGLVGFNDTGAGIDGSYSSCELTVSGNNPEMIGGLVGYNNGLISESYASGEVVDVYLIAGGLVGYNFLGTITSCYAVGDVSGANRVGGLVGDSRQVITNSYASGSVSGNSDIGGLVGLLEGTVSNSYAWGLVSGSNLLGGLVGSLNGEGTVSNCYFDTDKTGQSDTDKGVPKTTVEMIDQNTFTGWDFGTVWIIDTDPASYPYLQWQTGNVPRADLPGVSLGQSVMTKQGNPGQYEINAISYSNSSNAYKNDGTLELLFNDGDIDITVTASVYRPEATINAADKLTESLNENEEFNSAYEATNSYSGYIIITNRLKEEDKEVVIQFRDPDDTGVMFNEYGSQSQPGRAPVAGTSTTPVLSGSFISETIKLRVTQYQLDKVVPVAVFAHDSAITVAERIRAALAGDTDVSKVLNVSTSGTDIILTQRSGCEVSSKIGLSIANDV